MTPGGACRLLYNTYYAFYCTLYTIKFIFFYAFHNILSQIFLPYSVLTGFFCYRLSEILTAPQENTDILEGPSYYMYNWKLKCDV